MPKQTKREERGERVQVPSMTLHPETLKVLDQISRERLVNRGIAIDEVVRRYQDLQAQLERMTRGESVAA